VGQYQIEEFAGCSYLPLDRVLPRILREERTHVAIDRRYPRGLDMFGRAKSRRAARDQHRGLKRRSNEGLGLTVPD
jgi:1,2-phenylacetyl-CoA epoxidase catalytic subunit